MKILIKLDKNIQVEKIYNRKNILLFYVLLNRP